MDSKLTRSQVSFIFVLLAFLFFITFGGIYIVGISLYDKILHLLVGFMVGLLFYMKQVDIGTTIVSAFLFALIIEVVLSPHIILGGFIGLNNQLDLLFTFVGVLLGRTIK